LNPLKPYLIGGGVLALLGFLIWAVTQWKGHDKAEQTIGQTACIQTVQAVGSAQVEQSAGIDQANAKILSDQVADYDETIRKLNADNVDLAQRLHDAAAKNSVRGGAVPAIPRAAGELPGSGDQSGPTACDRRLAADLEVCARNTIELQSIRTAWQRLADEAKKKGADKAP
jgi:hypothetical protein